MGLALAGRPQDVLVYGQRCLNRAARFWDEDLEGRLHHGRRDRNSRWNSSLVPAGSGKWRVRLPISSSFAGCSLGR